MLTIYSGNTISIRQFVVSEEALFCDFFDDSEVTRYLPSLDKKDYQVLFARIFEDYKAGPLGRWGIFDSANGEYAGNCLLRIFAEDPSCYEIGYSIGREYWGKGLGTEIAKALVSYAFDKTVSGDLCALTHPDNRGSQRVLEKAGFVKTVELVRNGAFLFLFKLSRGI